VGDFRPNGRCTAYIEVQPPILGTRGLTLKFASVLSSRGSAVLRGTLALLVVMTSTIIPLGQALIVTAAQDEPSGPAGTPTVATFRFNPTGSTQASPPGTVAVQMVLDANTNIIDGFQAQVSFAPTGVFNVIDTGPSPAKGPPNDPNGQPCATGINIDPGQVGAHAFEDEAVINCANNATGVIQFAVLTFQNDVAGNVTMATITFQAAANAPCGSSVTVQYSGTNSYSSNNDAASAEVTPILGPSLTLTTPACATLNGSLSLQGRTLNTPASAVPVRVQLLQQGNVLYTFNNIPTLANGTFSVALYGVPNGTYDVRVKHAQSLSAQAAGLTFTVGNPTTRNFGQLRTGDVNNNDVVSGQDLALLLASFDKAVGDVGYDARADLNGNGAVTGQDLALLLSNFDVVGPTIAAAFGAGSGSAWS
jgi:hypothetical protein